MASEFYNKAYEEERKDWRQHNMTVLAIQMLKDNLAEAEREAFATSPGSGEKLNYLHGIRQGILDCIELLEQE